MNSWSGPKTQSVPALERGLLILEFLAQSRRGVTLSQLTRKLQLPRSTGHALLLTYQRTGYVQRCEKTGRYCLGFRLQALANLALGGTSLRTQVAPNLRQLMVDTGLTVHLAVMEDGEAVLIDRIEAPGAPHLATWVGKRMGLHCTAVGKSLISELPSNALDELISKQGLMRHNENTIASRRALRLACENVQKLGYAIDDEEEEIGVRCIGAPVRNSAGEIVAAISISGTKAQLENIPARAAQVMSTAAALSRQIGVVAEVRQLHIDRAHPVVQEGSIEVGATS
ncbi:MAG TPA: IclR family transcriptional regulator [Terriglobales bacterium]|jgi:DNA-binding IclR family transcriptional regulator|nr:IclR family transcriptional regulator [Terriglobales bacterium]